jgi:hypothetical protein
MTGQRTKAVAATGEPVMAAEGSLQTLAVLFQTLTPIGNAMGECGENFS